MRLTTPDPTDSENSQKFYKLMWSNTGPWGIAYAPSQFDVWLKPREELLPTWTVPHFRLLEGPPADYQPSDAGVPLCSVVLREIFDTHRHNTDLVEWLPVKVSREHDNSFTCYILHLLEELDVLDLSRSLLNTRGGVIKPHLSLAKVQQQQLFRYIDGGESTVCLSEKIHTAMVRQKCTACHFWQMPAT